MFILKAIERRLKSPMKPRSQKEVAAGGPLMAASCVTRVRLLNRHTHAVADQSRQRNARRRFLPRNVGYLT
jgi:hypothetical protein